MCVAWVEGLVEACYSSFSCLDHSIAIECVHMVDWCDVLNKRGSEKLNKRNNS